MKTLLIFLLSFSAQASNWMPVSKIQSNSTQAYQLESECVKQSQEQCLDVGNQPQKVALGYASLEDEYLKADSQACLNQADCDLKFTELTCSQQDWQKIKNIDLLEVYCVKLIGKKLTLDEASWTAYQNAQNAAQAQSAALGQAKKARECGSSVMDLVLVRNTPKALTKGQVKQLVTTLNPIKSLLETGSLVTAKEEVQAIAADGTIITEGDKLAVVAAIDSCLGL